MGFIKNMMKKSLSNKLRNESIAQKMIKCVESWGTYDGSETSVRKSKEAYELIRSDIGLDKCPIPTKESRIQAIYDKTLRESRMPIPLCAVYAFVLENHIIPGLWDPSQAAEESIKKSALSLELLHPDYGNYVYSRHSEAEGIIILSISGGYLEAFLDPELLERTYAMRQ